MLAGGALETSEIAGDGQPQLISQRHRRSRQGTGQFSEIRHELTLRVLATVTKIAYFRILG